MLSLALNALSLPRNIKDPSALIATQQATCPDGCAAQATVHGDPMFKVRSEPGQTLTHPQVCLCADTLTEMVDTLFSRSMARARTSGSVRAS